MKSADVIKELMKERGLTLAVMASKLGNKSTSTFSDKIYNKHGIRDDLLVKIFEELDCELIVRSKTKGHKEWVINGKDEE